MYNRIINFKKKCGEIMDSKKFDFKLDNEINDIEGYKFFLDNLQAPISICTLEKNPRYIYVNDEMLKLIGVNRNNFNDNDYRASDFVLEDDTSSNVGDIENDLVGGNSYKVFYILYFPLFFLIPAR